MTKEHLERLRMLVEFHNEDNDELGEAARELSPLLAELEELQLPPGTVLREAIALFESQTTLVATLTKVADRADCCNDDDMYVRADESLALRKAASLLMAQPVEPRAKPPEDEYDWDEKLRSWVPKFQRKTEKPALKHMTFGVCPCKGHPYFCFSHPHNCGCTAERTTSEPG